MCYRFQLDAARLVKALFSINVDCGRPALTLRQHHGGGSPLNHGVPCEQQKTTGPRFAKHAKP